MIKSKMTITFDDKELVPKILIEGELDMIQMAALPFHISLAFQQHLDEIGQMLKKKAQAKGIETETKKVEKANNLTGVEL